MNLSIMWGRMGLLAAEKVARRTDLLAAEKVARRTDLLAAGWGGFPKEFDWPGDVAHRTTLRSVARGRARRHTLGGLGQRCDELIANCD